VNRALFGQTWRAQGIKLALVSAALAIWGFLMPVIYAQFGSQFRAILESGILPAQFAKLGGGDIFTLPGSIALSLIHPIAIILTSVFSVGFSATAIAGERQRGTLEVALARPIARQIFYRTLLAASFSFVAVTVTVLLAGGIAGAAFAGVTGELPIRHFPLLWLNAILLFGAIAAMGLAASSSFDRVAPALGVTLGFVIVMYFLEILGSLWPAAAPLQPYSLFHYLKAKAILKAGLRPIVCVGETDKERDAQETFGRICAQLDGGLDGLPASEAERIVIAYEPVWAIGTGRTATPAQAEEVHAFIRGKLAERWGEVAERVRIQYGGSVKSANARELMSQPDVDGALVGGASLEDRSFADIVKNSI